jgi:DedD protein
MPPIDGEADTEAPDDLRSTIESAIDGAEGGDAPAAPDAPVAPDREVAPVEKPAGEPQVQAKGDRDSLGRFLPKGKEAPGAPGAPAGTPGPTQAAPAQPGAIQPAPLAPAPQAPAS